MATSRWTAPKGTYEAFVKKYGEVCGVCGKPPKPGRKLHLDHDHATGLARGLLCFYDNYRVIGRHNLQRLKQAVAYLERHEREVQEQAKKRRPDTGRAHPRRRKAPHSGGKPDK